MLPVRSRCPAPARGTRRCAPGVTPAVGVCHGGGVPEPGEHRARVHGSDWSRLQGPVAGRRYVRFSLSSSRLVGQLIRTAPVSVEVTLIGYVALKYRGPFAVGFSGHGADAEPHEALLVLATDPGELSSEDDVVVVAGDGPRALHLAREGAGVEARVPPQHGGRRQAFVVLVAALVRLPRDRSCGGCRRGDGRGSTDSHRPRPVPVGRRRCSRSSGCDRRRRPRRRSARRRRRRRGSR